MPRILSKRKISDKNLERFESAGRSTGRWLRRNSFVRRTYTWLNEMGTKHPKAFIASMTLLNLGIIAGSTLFPTPQVAELPTVELRSTKRYNDSLRIIEENIQSLLNDAQKISDSVQAVLEKEHLTYEDTLFVVSRGEYIKKIHNIIQNK